MSKNDIIPILLAWFFLTPAVLCVVVSLPALVVLFFCRKVVPVMWRHYPRWWRYLPLGNVGGKNNAD